ncbi:hypothetical protein RRG08_045458 [Elysia crispata]|uniref:Uncharacterized protein n=1 Tax=Elysia crispata TaxID=231223 RepID=A0AAE1AWX3_9GAST|nr:hypothetical protein RRG08_045458 [Elysia crispata]
MSCLSPSPCSPNISPSYFILSHALKRHSMGQRSHPDHNVLHASESWLTVYRSGVSGDTRDGGGNDKTNRWRGNHDAWPGPDGTLAHTESFFFLTLKLQGAAPGTWTQIGDVLLNRRAEIKLVTAARPWKV